jgi:DNA-binding XRE family transcriptional regulator
MQRRRLRVARSYNTDEVNTEKQEIAQSIAARLREARTDRGMTIVELSKCAGISRQAVYSIEGGDMCPSLHLLRLLCEALGLKASELLGW